MDKKRPAHRPTSDNPATLLITIKATPEQKAKFLELGGSRWVKRLINEAIGGDKPTQAAHDGSAEWVVPYKGGWTDRRNVELQADGSYILRDPVTMKAYNVSTGEAIEQTRGK